MRHGRDLIERRRLNAAFMMTAGQKRAGRGMPICEDARRMVQTVQHGGLPGQVIESPHGLAELHLAIDHLRVKVPITSYGNAVANIHSEKTLWYVGSLAGRLSVGHALQQRQAQRYTTGAAKECSSVHTICCCHDEAP